MNLDCQAFKDEGHARRFCIYVVSWNVGGKKPPEVKNLLNLLNIERDEKSTYAICDPDFYAIGLQEIPSQKSGGMLRSHVWTNRLIEILSERDYILIKTQQLQKIIIILFAKRKHLLHLRQIEGEESRTGLAGIFANKGAVSIRLNAYGCSICLLNSHFSANDNSPNERIEDYKQILANHRYHVPLYSEIYNHDFVVWFGDMNFRLRNKAKLSADDISKLIEANKRDELLKMDELNYLKQKGEMFSELKENSPRFPPTFKFEHGMPYYDLKRRPAWTDRILFRMKANVFKNIEFNLEQMSYDSHPECDLSDHRPVKSEFHIEFVKTKAEFLKTLKKEPDSKHPEIRRTDPTIMQRIYSDPSEKIIKFSPIEEWLIDGENTIEYSIPEGLKEYPGSDWIGLFRKDFDDLTKYIAYLYVPKSHSDPLDNPEPRPSETIRRLQMDFSENNVNIMDGETYLLIYFQREESGPTGIVGISNCFRAIREKEGEVIKSHNRGLHCHLPSCLPQHEHQHDN